MSTPGLRPCSHWPSTVPPQTTQTPVLVSGGLLRRSLSSSSWRLMRSRRSCCQRLSSSGVIFLSSSTASSSGLLGLSVIDETQLPHHLGRGMLVGSVLANELTQLIHHGRRLARLELI